MQDQLFNAGPVNTHRRGSHQKGGMCRQPGCTNMARAKQGARYCEQHARSIDYGPVNWELALTTARTCSCCGENFTGQRRQARTTNAGLAWLSICPPCRRVTPLSRDTLTKHRVPERLAGQWLAKGAALRCDLCERQLDRRTKAGLPSVDHDHNCCPGHRSCGRCIRGLLCGRCNTYIGYLEGLEKFSSLDNVAAYLSRRSPVFS